MSYDLRVNIIYKDNNEESLLYSYWDSGLKRLVDQRYSSRLNPDLIESSSIKLGIKFESDQVNTYSYNSVVLALTKIKSRISDELDIYNNRKNLINSINYYMLTDDQKDSLDSDINDIKSSITDLELIRDELVGLIYMINSVMDNANKYIEDNYYIVIEC